MALQKSEVVQASDKTIQSIQAEISGRDLLLSPRLDAEAADARDDRDTLTEDQKFHSRLLNVSLTKLFATGTQLGVTVGNTLNTTDLSGTRRTGLWELKLSQSLWRDAFGRSTSLRHEAEKNEVQNRVLATLYQRQSFLVDLESAYWDLVQSLKELEIRRSNIERSETVAKWTRDRVRRRTAETSDLAQAEALVSSRRLDLLAVQSRISTFRTRLNQFVPDLNLNLESVRIRELENQRPLAQLLARTAGEGEPVRLDALSAQFRSQQASFESERVKDGLRPKLDAYVSYGEAGVDPQASTAWQRAGDPRYSESRVGVLFSVDLDSGTKNNQQQAAVLAAQARELEARAQGRSSTLGWADLSRQIEDLKIQLTEAQLLADLQEKKVRAETERYRLGRTTVFQLISFEIDAANAKVALSQILANLRKAESQARLFTREKGSAS
jgi:outer membrane protein TolC